MDSIRSSPSCSLFPLRLAVLPQGLLSPPAMLSQMEGGSTGPCAWLAAAGPNRPPPPALLSLVTAGGSSASEDTADGSRSSFQTRRWATGHWSAWSGYILNLLWERSTLAPEVLIQESVVRPHSELLLQNGA